MSNAIDLAGQGLRIQNQLMDISAKNMKGVNDPTYSKQTAVVSSNVVGGGSSPIQIATVERFYNENLNRSLRDQSSISHKYKEITEHMNVVKGIVGAGNKDDARSPENLVNNFFSAMQTLSGSFVNDALKTNVVNQGQQLAVNLSDISSKLYHEQYVVDKELSTSIGRVNDIIINLKEVNASIAKVNHEKGQNNALYQTRDNMLKELAEHIDVNVNINQYGIADVSTKSSVKLLNDHTYGELKYSSTTSSSDFSNHKELGAITVDLYDHQGDFLRESELVSRGISGKDIKTDISGGKISGLLDLRDEILPKMNQTLDHLAKEVAFQVNKIHNTGTGFPAATDYTGTTRTTMTNYTNWEGMVRIAMVNQDGTDIKRDDDTKFKALELDLGKLDGGKGAGSIDIKTIIREINQHFNYDVGVRRAEVKDNNSQAKIFRDVKMVATSNVINNPPANNMMKFKMEIDSVSQTDTSFSISDIVVRDKNGTIIPNAGTINNGYSVIKAGVKTRSDQEMSIDIGATQNPPYEVDIEYRTMNEDGKYSTGTITYVLNPNDPTDMMNVRFMADRATGSAEMKNPDGKAYMSAHLVDDLGNVVLDNDIDTKGVLSLKTNDNEYRIIIDDMGSVEKGLPASGVFSATPASERGFSHFFGLNDFFASPIEDENHALNMKMNSRLLNNPNTLSTGRMVQSNSFESKEVSFGKNIADMTMTFSNAPNFDNADTISVLGQTFRMVTLLTGADDEIEIGGNMNASLDNITVALNKKYHPGMLLTENMSNGGVFSLKFSAAKAGAGGNHFKIAGSFSAMQGDIGAGMQNGPSGDLTGGSDITDVRKIKTYGYSIGRDSNQVILDLAKLDKTNFVIDAAGGLAGGTMTLEGYATATVGYALREGAYASSSYSNAETLYKNFQNVYESGASVDIAEEQIKASGIMHLSNALTKIMSVQVKMNDALLQII